MSREHDETDLEQLLRRNRPAPPPPPAGEYARILAATRGKTATSAAGIFKYLPWALAATFVIALAATFIMDDGRPTAASNARDERLEAFLSDTVGEVVLEQPEPAVNEPLNVYDTFMENGGQ